MMKNIITILLLGLTFNTIASEDACVDQITNFGDGNGNDKISIQCYELFKANANSSIASQDKSKNIFGHKNLIVFEDLDSSGNVTKKNVIAGSSTMLKSIKSISLDESNNELVVLDENGDVFFFSTILMGNIAPFRVLRNQNIHGANIVLVNPTKDHVYVYNQAQGNLFIFSRLANFYGREGKKRLNVLKDFTNLPKTGTKLLLDDENNKLILLQNETQLHTINL